MIIMGIDPGSRKTGIGIIRSEGRKLHFVSSHIVRMEKIESQFERVNCVFNEITNLVQKFSPDAVALESLIYVKSPTALIKLAQVRGAILAALSLTHLGKIFEYSPNLIKSVATGYGHSSKEGVRLTMDMLLGKQKYATDDESDAVAIAVCHAINAESSSRMSSAIFTGKSKNRSLSKSISHKVKRS